MVDRDRREGRVVKPYRVMSKSFLAGAWSGIKVEDLRRDADGRVSFRVGPRSVRKLDKLTAEIGPIDFPDTYTHEKGGPLPRFIKKNLSGIRDPDAAEDFSKIEWFCTDCSFRPWIDFANATTATVTFVDPNGSTERVAATEENGRWRTARRLGRGEGAVVGRGCLQDGFDDFNGLQARTGSLAAGVDAACAAAGDLARLQLERGARRCGLPQGRLRGRILGRAGLSRKRWVQRRRFPTHTRPRRSMDRFCLTDPAPHPRRLPVEPDAAPRASAPT